MLRRTCTTSSSWRATAILTCLSRRARTASLPASHALCALYQCTCCQRIGVCCPPPPSSVRSCPLPALAPTSTRAPQQAAADLAVGVTTLKKVCRRHNIGRWPFRKRSSLNRLIEKTKQYFKNDPEQCAEAVAKLEAQRSVLQVRVRAGHGQHWVGGAAGVAGPSTPRVPARQPLLTGPQPRMHTALAPRRSSRAWTSLTRSSAFARSSSS